MDKVSTKSDLIAETLAEEIIRSEIEPGSRLGQSQIAERFKTSHVPVREALQRLVQMELATSEPRRGVRVFALSSADHDEIREMRLALEPLALRLAVENINAAHLHKIEALRQTCDEAVDPIGWEKANRAFHLAIVGACGQPRLLRQIQHLQRLSAHRFHARWRATWVRSPDRDHSALVQALTHRKADAACQILGKHLRRR